jgi:hypothetical protein
VILPGFLSQYIAIKNQGQSINDRLNYLIDFQLTYRTRHEARYYGDILLDDITFPIGYRGQFYVKRKAGFLAGFDVPRPAPGIDNFVMEAVYTDSAAAQPATPGTYLHLNPALDFARYGQVIGNPIGPGSSGVVGRADFASRGQWSYYLQGSIEQHHRESATPDVEIAGLVGGSRRLGRGVSVGMAVRPYTVHHPGALSGKDQFRTDGQVFFSAQF